MANVVATNGSFSVRAYRGDAKTLLAFNLPKPASRRLAGFTIQVAPPGVEPYYLLNELQFERPAAHAQVATLPANSSVNAPIHKFRWLHVPGTAHQGLSPVFGTYVYTVTPRYFDDSRSLQALDPALGAAVSIDVKPFDSGPLKVGFTRGFVQSQAFVRHFTPKAVIRPAGHDLQFDTSQQAGVDSEGTPFTFADEYRWLGFTARERIFELLNEVLKRPSLKLDVFAYDLNEPDVVTLLLKLARRGGVRIILDNAALHHSSTTPTPEDTFETLFTAAARKGSAILRGKFGRYSHDKVFIVSDGRGPKRVLTGSTNLSVTGLYVNSNHVLVFTDRAVAATYARVFELAWTEKAKRAAFANAELGKGRFDLAEGKGPAGIVTFSPHSEAFATEILDGLAARVAREGTRSVGAGSVLFAVMEMGSASTGPVFPALRALHADRRIFSYGISDNPEGIALYKPGTRSGVLVTGRPTRTKLPRPFSQVPSIGGGHQIHHKFVVCGFNTKEAVVYCGSSNLALGGEQDNGDNLLEIRDPDVATVFAIEAVALVDHFHFLNKVSTTAGTSPSSQPEASKPQAAVDAGWFLGTTDRWTRPYFDPEDLHHIDRELFA